MAVSKITDLPKIAESESAVRFLADVWADRDFEAAREWVQGHEQLDAIAPAVRPMVATWANRNARAASEWIGQLPDSPAKQQAVVGLVGMMINEDQMDHEAAFAWTEQIDKELSSRSFYFELIVKDWLKEDPVAGRAAAEATDLPEETKQRLLTRYGRNETQSSVQP